MTDLPPEIFDHHTAIVENRAALDQEAVARFWAGVKKSDGCWLWVRTKRNGSHGSMSFHDEPIYVHRLSYAIHHGPIPPGLFVCHRCDVPNCVRPDHLFVGSQAENIADMFAKGRRPAPRGRFGSQNHKVTLTAAQVADIRRRGGENQHALGREFGVSQSTVWRIQRGETRING